MKKNRCSQASKTEALQTDSRDMKKIAKVFGVLIFIAAIFSGLFFYFQNEIFGLGKKLPKIRHAADVLIQEVEKEVSAPPPLRVDREESQVVLTREGVVKFTNSARASNGLNALKISEKLNISAALKLKDLFAGQYFEHVSPSGKDIGDLVDEAGYAYILIGENLALGNFSSDADLVNAWMESPAHRENILNRRYTQIGVAVGKGVFEGETTWIAVQHFGLPESACPLPNPALKTRIEANNAQLVIWTEEINNLRVEIDSVRPKRGADYKEKIDKFNELVKAYNSLLEETRGFIDEYNAQVYQSNKCKTGI